MKDNRELLIIKDSRYKAAKKEKQKNAKKPVHKKSNKVYCADVMSDRAIRELCY